MGTGKSDRPHEPDEAETDIRRNAPFLSAQFPHMPTAPRCPTPTTTNGRTDERTNGVSKETRRHGMPDDMGRKSKTAPPDETDEAGRRTSGNDIARRTWDDPARPLRPTARYDKTGGRHDIKRDGGTRRGTRRAASQNAPQDETRNEMKDETTRQDDRRDAAPQDGTQDETDKAARYAPFLSAQFGVPMRHIFIRGASGGLDLLHHEKI